MKSENAKTITFLVTALVVVTLAVVLRQRERVQVEPEEVNQKLFPDFEDPLAAQSLEIVKYDEAAAQVERFRVAKKSGVWMIPSHEGYPADATQQVAKAAAAIIDLKILGIASDDPTLHGEFGVLEPDASGATQGQEGVGTLVVMQDASNDLARFVIGAEVKDQPGLRYVRRSGQDRVYRVAVNTEPLSTDFNDWIETDLLQLNAGDLKRLTLKDYAFEASLTGTGRVNVEIPQKSNMTLEMDEATQQWRLVELVEFEDNEPVKSGLAEGERLATAKVNELRTALDQLKIVDVARKPAGLSEALRQNKSFNDQAAVRSLAQRGFYFFSPDGEQTNMYSSEGELIATTRDGVEYVLRFGGIAGVSEAEAAPDPEDSDPEDGEEPGSSVNRYLFVLARFNENLIPKPELKPLPGEESDDSETVESEPASASGETTAEEDRLVDSDEAEADVEAAPAGEATPSGESTPTGESTAEGKTARQLATERKAIETENRRAQKAYDDRVAAAKKTVKDLNARFADWYYVIPDDVFQKIHLSKADLVEGAPPAARSSSVFEEEEMLPGDEVLLPSEEMDDAERESTDAAPPELSPALQERVRPSQDEVEAETP